MKDKIPATARPQRLSPSDKKIVDEIMELWMAKGIIKVSYSDYASPIVLMKKKAGNTRVCFDYRELNKKIESPRFPLPLIEDQIDALEGTKIFTTIDIKNGYFHVPVDKNSQKYTAFVTPTNQYEFLKTPFGLLIAPAIFQGYINAIFRQLIKDKIVITYMDDLIIRADNMEDAVHRFKQVIDVAQQHGL